ncbi:hypothetical protein [Halostella salina]|uniref:hypothetical protein n=1 Tax=Halostella salina TaxID=1547897 RepID=UPI000EF8033B|nr:hypothetical protein [Halostella salina]
MQFRFTRSEKVGMTASLTVVLSAFLPWTTQGLGRVSTSGIGYGYLGGVTALLGLVAFAAVLAWGWRVRTRALMSGVGLIVTLGVAGLAVGLHAGTNPGLGLVTTAIAAAALLGSGAYGLFADDARRRRTTA